MGELYCRCSTWSGMPNWWDSPSSPTYRRRATLRSPSTSSRMRRHDLVSPWSVEILRYLQLSFFLLDLHVHVCQYYRLDDNFRQWNCFLWLFIDCPRGSPGFGWPGLLGEVGRSGTVTGEPPGGGDGIPEDQELWQTLFPLSYHRQPGEAQENDENWWENVV